MEKSLERSYSRISPLSVRSHSSGKLTHTATILQETRLSRSFLKNNAQSYLRLRVTFIQPTTKWKQYATPQLAGQMDRVMRLVKTSSSEQNAAQAKALNRAIERMVSLVRTGPRLDRGPLVFRSSRML